MCRQEMVGFNCTNKAKLLLCKFSQVSQGDNGGICGKGNQSALFVFSVSDTKQNARSLLTPVSGTVFYALSHGSLGFALHGSFFNHLLIG